MLSLEGVGFGYRAGSEVLRGVTFGAGAGVATLMGPNGAGKSTLLRLVLGALEPMSGSIRVRGEDPARLSGAERARRIVYVPQRGVVSAPFTVREVVALGRGGRADPAVDAALERVELLERAGELYEALSVGQQQRAVLARALAQAEGLGPGVLLCDEPFSAMDPAWVGRCAGLVRGLAARGWCVVVVLHDFALASALGGSAVLLDGDGRVAAEGGAAGVLEPTALERVFGVGFETVETGWGRAALPVYFRDGGGGGV